MRLPEKKSRLTSFNRTSWVRVPLLVSYILLLLSASPHAESCLNSRAIVINFLATVTHTWVTTSIRRVASNVWLRSFFSGKINGIYSYLHGLQLIGTSDYCPITKATTHCAVGTRFCYGQRFSTIVVFVIETRQTVLCWLLDSTSPILKQEHPRNFAGVWQSNWTSKFARRVGCVSTCEGSSTSERS